MKELQNKDEDTQIAQIIMREATNGNKDYLDYFDFRYMFFNTQSIHDFQLYIYLKDEINVEPDVAEINKSNNKLANYMERD